LAAHSCLVLNSRVAATAKPKNFPSHRKSDKFAITVTLRAMCVSRVLQKCGPMLDNETIAIHLTKIVGKSYLDDYTVIWRGLPIGRIRKNPGLPAHVDQWSWGCNVCGQPSLNGDSGSGTDLEDCEAQFKLAWTRIRARLTDRDIAKAYEMRQW
jgi:hypothetical protein